jgi:hypothetical protein
MYLKFGLPHQGEVRTLAVSDNSTEENISTYYKRRKSQEVGENCVLTSFMIFTQQMLLGW